MSAPGIHSTPVSTKDYSESDHEMMNMMQLLLEKQNTMLCTKFDEQNVQFNELNERISDSQKSIDIKFNNIEQQNVKFEDNINKRLNCLLYTSRCV